MSRHAIGLAALAAAIMVAIVGIALTAKVTTNHASTEIYGIDVIGLTSGRVDEFSAQRHAAH